MAQKIRYCSCSALINYCSTCKSSSNVIYYVKESDHKSVIGAKNSEIAAKNCEIQNLKSEMNSPTKSPFLNLLLNLSGRTQEKWTKRVGAYKEMLEKDAKFIAIVMAKMFDIE